MSTTFLKKLLFILLSDFGDLTNITWTYFFVNPFLIKKFLL